MSVYILCPKACMNCLNAFIKMSKIHGYNAHYAYDKNSRLWGGKGGRKKV